MPQLPMITSCEREALEVLERTQPHARDLPHAYIDAVGQFWRPHRVSMRKLEMVLRAGLKHFREKPRMRFIDNPEYGMFVCLWVP